MLTEGARYVADLRFESKAHACFVRSALARGRLTSVETAGARARPGVLGVFDAADLDLPDLKPVPVVDQRMTRPILARDTVRFVGEPVVAVVAETAAAAADAAEHVVVDIEPRLAVVALPDAASGDTLVHQDAGTNVAFDMPAIAQTADPAPAAEASDGGGLDFSGCEVVVEASLVNQRLAAVPLEPRSAAAEWSADGARLTFYASTQAPHRVRDALAALYGLDKAAVRVVTPDVGGGFGAKGAPSPEELVLAGLARAVGRPVVWTESRAENLTSSVHGRAQSQRLRLGGTRAGRITHYELDVAQDAGAYPMIGAFLPTYTRKVFTGCYHIAHASISGRSYVTNTAPVTAYRGAGRPEAIFAIERAVDLYAARIGMDPAEVRRLNFVAPEHFPYTNSAGSTYDSGDFGAALDRALAAAGYGELRSEQARRRADSAPALLGIGIASYVESTSMGPSELGEIELAADGSLVVRTGATAFGQGHATCWAMIAADATGVPLDRISRDLRGHGRDRVQRAHGRLPLRPAGRLGRPDRGPAPGGTGPRPGRGPPGGRRGRRGARCGLGGLPCGRVAAASGRLGRHRSPSGSRPVRPRSRRHRTSRRPTTLTPSAATWPRSKWTPPPARRCCAASSPVTTPAR